MRYSNSTKSFYPDGLHYLNLPGDIVNVPDNVAFSAMQRGPLDTLDYVNGELVVNVFVAPTISLAQAQANQVTLINDACQALIVGGHNSSALGAVYTYPSSLTDQANLNANVVSSLLPDLASGWTTQQICLSSAGVWAYLPHTAAQIQQVGSDVKSAIVALLVKGANYKAQIAACTTVDAVQAVVWQN